jgi:hypothetical protein
MPKRGFAPIPKGDDCGGIEDFHIFVVAWVAGSDPNLIVVFPLKPRPTKAKSRGLFLQVKHSKPPIYFGATNGFPINLALGPGGGILNRPNKCPL